MDEMANLDRKDWVIMFCSKCGNEIGEDEAVCPKCGAAVKTPNQKVKKSRKKFFVFLGVGIVFLIAAIALICYFHSAPYLYATAVSYFDEGDYVRAEEIFLRTGDYQDSASLLAESKYLHAQECLQSGDYDQALALLREYETSPDYKVTRESQIISYKEKIADAYRGQERYEDAVELYQVLGRTWETAEMYAAMENYIQALAITQDYSFGNSAEKETRKSWCRTQAIIYIKEENYEEAWKCLQQYDERLYDGELCEYAYQLACAFVDSKKYEEVLLLTEKIKNHKDNEAKLLESTCYETQGIDCAQKGDYESAWEYFAKCEITDAGRPYLYTTGQFYMEQDAYPDAYAIWTALGDYEDSAEMMLRTRYKWAKAASAQGNYKLAVQFLQELGNYEDSEELIRETYHEWAKATSAQGDYELAVQILQELGNYEDSEELIRETYHEWAKAASAQGDYELAIQILQGLGDYEDSAELLAEAEEKLYQKTVEEEKKARRGVLSGTWKTEDDNLRIEVGNAEGRMILRFKMPIERSSVTTIAGTFYGDNIKCGLRSNIFDGANSSSVEYGDILNKTYYWDMWDYSAETLYLNAGRGGWYTYSCTISGSIMTLKMDGQTFKLTKQ